MEDLGWNIVWLLDFSYHVCWESETQNGCLKEGDKMAMSMFFGTNNKLNNLQFLQFRSSRLSTRTTWKPLQCTPLEEQVDAGILCEPCKGRGWLLCDFCKGQKTNVKSETKRVYRRCPSCRAVGYTLCSNCKVFKCVTFPNYNDGESLI